MEPKNVIKFALRANLSAIAITDHNTIKGSLEALNLKPRDLIVVPGAEVNTEKGDLIILFTENEVRSRSFLEVIDKARQEDDLIILPHPYRDHSSIKELVGTVDIVEAFNGRRPRKENEQALKLATRFEKPVVSSSDAHLFFEIGKTKTRLYTEVNDLEELRKKLLTSTRKLIFARSTFEPFVAHYISCFIQLFKNYM